jgi:cytochrome c oxidase subunit 4
MSSDHSNHIVSPGLYVAIFLALLVLTAVTVGVTYINLGVFNLAVAMAIAVTKASLVILFFMHVKYSPKIIKVTVGMSFFFLAIMMIMVMSDYLSRGYMGMPDYPTAVYTHTESLAVPQPAKAPAEGAGEEH